MLLLTGWIVELEAQPTSTKITATPTRDTVILIFSKSREPWKPTALANDKRAWPNVPLALADGVEQRPATYRVSFASSIVRLAEGSAGAIDDIFWRQGRCG